MVFLRGYIWEPGGWLVVTPCIVVVTTRYPEIEIRGEK
jgi:hypothetical protein